MKPKPPKRIAEGDVILVYLPGDTHKFSERIHRYLQLKEKILALHHDHPDILPRKQKEVEDEIKADPNNILKRLELGLYYEIQDELSKAVDVIENVINDLLSKQETCADLYIRLGFLYALQGDYEYAHSAYKEGLNSKYSGLKLRPAVCLRQLPPNYDEFLVCGLSTQLHRYVKGFDDKVKPDSTHDNLRQLQGESVIRLGFLGRVRRNETAGTIGSISKVRHRRLLKKLSDYLVAKP